MNYVRFADDLLVTGRSREQLENEVKPVVERFLVERGLELSVEKTRIVHVGEGFDFLGQHVRKYGNGKVLTCPSKKSVKALLDRVRAILKASGTLTTGQMLVQLNPVIQGWDGHILRSAHFDSGLEIDPRSEGPSPRAALLAVSVPQAGVPEHETSALARQPAEPTRTSLES